MLLFYLETFPFSILRCLSGVFGSRIKVMKLLRLACCLVLLSASTSVPVSAEESASPPETSITDYEETNAPSITSTYCYLMDADTNQVLLDRNGEERMEPASMTKMMTAILTIEHLDLNQEVTITDAMWDGLIEANASVAGFWPGNTVTVKDLLYGILLPSGADAVQAAAITVSGSVSSFIDLMNEKAAELGMNDTHFANATGLHDSDHYSTAHDMAILLQYCIQNDTFCQILLTPSYTTGPIDESGTTVTLSSSVWSMVNNGENSYSIDGFLGGKTGYTTEAGRCLASHAEVNGMHLILVTGQSEGTGHVADAATLYNWYAQNYSRRTILEAGQSIASIPVVYSLPEATLETSAADTVTMDLPSDAEVSIVSDLPETIEAPISAGQQLGTYSVSVNDQILYTASAVSDQSVSRSTLAVILARLDDLWTNHRVFAIALIVLILLLIRIIHVQIHNARVRKKRRNRKHRRHS
jgi:D-alanyl-D-alanine carboxypeptidase (penicillin-binding protein 5/6)